MKTTERRGHGNVTKGYNPWWVPALATGPVDKEHMIREVVPEFELRWIGFVCPRLWFGLLGTLYLNTFELAEGEGSVCYQELMGMCITGRRALTLSADDAHLTV